LLGLFAGTGENLKPFADAGFQTSKELMSARKARPRSQTRVLLVEGDVLIRFAIGEYLRACAITVIEAAGADDARAILLAGPKIHILLSDAELAGEGSGFMLAKWVRRHRPQMEVLLTASIEGKAHAAAELLARLPDCAPAADVAALVGKIKSMLAERKRRLRHQPHAASIKPKRSQA
jgi:DNA-binding NtrC family response regulator